MTRIESSIHSLIFLCFNLFFWQVHDVFTFNVKTWIQIFQPRPSTTKKLFIFSVNGVLSYSPKCALLQGNRQKTRKSLDISKLEIHVRVHDFIFRTFEHFYIIIWLCILLENVLEKLPLLMPKTLVNQFVFVQGRDQCIIIMGQFTHSVYYYLKDL